MPSRRIKNSGAYQYAAGTRDFVKVGCHSANNTMFVGEAVENVEVVMTDIVAKKDIGNEPQE